MGTTGIKEQTKRPKMVVTTSLHDGKKSNNKIASNWNKHQGSKGGEKNFRGKKKWGGITSHDGEKIDLSTGIGTKTIGSPNKGRNRAAENTLSY